ncbi:MAG: hypothetical protein ACLFV6_01175 [Spirulinaceae cyanobacterium]
MTAKENDEITNFITLSCFVSSQCGVDCGFEQLNYTQVIDVTSINPYNNLIIFFLAAIAPCNFPTLVAYFGQFG